MKRFLSDKDGKFTEDVNFSKVSVLYNCILGQFM